MQNNQPHHALLYLRKAGKAYPASREVLTDLGSAYMAIGDYKNSVGEFKVVQNLPYTKGISSARKRSDRAKVAYNLGTSLLKLSDMESPDSRAKSLSEAESQLKVATKLSPRNAFAYNNLGIALENQGNNQQAGESFLRAHEILPDQVDFTKNAGFAYLKAHNFPEASILLGKVFKADPTDAKTGLALASAFSEEGNYNSAIAVYDQMRPVEGKSSSYWFNLGYLRQKNGDNNGAMQAYAKCLAVSPNEIDALHNLAILKFKNGQYKQSETMFLQLSGLTIGSTEEEKNVVASAIKAGDNRTALNYLIKLVHKDPQNQVEQVQLANLYNNLGQFKQAKYHYQEVLNSNPKSAPAHNGMGLYWLHKSQLQLAYIEFHRAVEDDPKYVPGLDNLALTLEKLNHVKSAIHFLRRAHRIDPQNEDVSNNLHRMLESKE